VRLAIFSDVHGNSIALDAVLEDIARNGPVDGYLVLGDLTNIGPDPVGVLERLRSLATARFVRGNGDRYVVTGDLPNWFEGGKSDVELAAIRLEIATSLAWTRGAITVSGHYEWLARLPFDLRFALPDGARALCVHATHRRDDEYTLSPNRTDDELRALLADADAELVLAGHTHRPLDRTLSDRLRIVNPGSVSNPLPYLDDLRAGWSLLEASRDAYAVTSFLVDYDHEAVAEHARRVHYPAADFIARLQRVPIPT
jgi:predicted phosphodiesterase